MKFIDNILQKLKINCLTQRINNSGKKFYNWQTAKNVGIIYSAEDKDIEGKVKNFCDFLKRKNIRTKTIAYYTSSKQQSDEKSTSADYEFSNKNLTWLQCPKENSIKNFISQFFDIVILVCKKEFFPIIVVLAESDAGLKISPYFSDFEITDLSFMLKDNFSIDEYLENIKKYLIEIKTSD